MSKTFYCRDSHASDRPLWAPSEASIILFSLTTGGAKATIGAPRRTFVDAILSADKETSQKSNTFLSPLHPLTLCMQRSASASAI